VVVNSRFVELYKLL